MVWGVLWRRVPAVFRERTMPGDPGAAPLSRIAYPQANYCRCQAWTPASDTSQRRVLQVGCGIGNSECETPAWTSASPRNHARFLWGRARLTCLEPISPMPDFAAPAASLLHLIQIQNHLTAARPGLASAGAAHKYSAKTTVRTHFFYEKQPKRQANLRS